jgi:hypothetical protein
MCERDRLPPLRETDLAHGHRRLDVLRRIEAVTFAGLGVALIAMGIAALHTCAVTP